MFNYGLIIDGSYYLNRALSIPSFMNMKTKDGVHSGGVYGFLNSVEADIKKFPGYYPIVVFDSGISKRRVSLDEHYKNNDIRQVLEEDITKGATIDDNFGLVYKYQRFILAELLPKLGIPVVMYDNWEGDDLIFVLTKMFDKCVILTEDKDMWQLVNSKATIYRPMSKKTIDVKYIEENFGNVETFVKQKALLGDKSDNIPTSCNGVGDKFAKDLIRLLDYYNETIPRDETKVKEDCATLGIKYRKAYLEFNKERYNINCQLVDLNYVDYTKDLTYKIESKIDELILWTNLHDAACILNKYEIQFDIQEFHYLITNSYGNLFKHNSLF